ncbi:hypothetical protein ACSBR1_002372 [Camellia fascicularis]
MHPHLGYPKPFRFPPISYVPWFMKYKIIVVMDLPLPSHNLRTSLKLIQASFWDSLILTTTVAIELDTVNNTEFNGINDNHVGIDVNNLKFIVSAPALYYSNSEGKNKSLELISGDPMLVWIDYDEVENLLNITLAPIRSQKSNQPLLSTQINLSSVLLNSMLVSLLLLKCLEDLYKATKGFNDEELLGGGGFVKVYKGVLPSSKEQVAIKKISHDSKQGVKEFVAEIASMGRSRHRNLVQLLGYCRRKRELILVYDYMPNGSLDKFLFGNEKPIFVFTLLLNYKRLDHI